MARRSSRNSSNSSEKGNLRTLIIFAIVFLVGGIVAFILYKAVGPQALAFMGPILLVAGAVLYFLQPKDKRFQTGGHKNSGRGLK